MTSALKVKRVQHQLGLTVLQYTVQGNTLMLMQTLVAE